MNVNMAHEFCRHDVEQKKRKDVKIICRLLVV